MISLIATVILAGAQGEPDGNAPGTSFPEDFQVVLGLVEATGLDESLRGMEGKFTLFAPNDEAFAKLPEGLMEQLKKPANAEILKSILRYHVVPKRVPADAAKKATSAPTVEGTQLTLKLDGETLHVDKATVIGTGFEHAGGLVHAVDTVLVPAAVAKSIEAPIFGCATLCELLGKAELKATLSSMEGYTLFAPTDAAFAALKPETRKALLAPQNRDALQRVLKHHAMASQVDSATAQRLAEGAGDEKGARLTLLDSWAWLEVGENGLMLGGADIIRTDESVPSDWGKGTVHVLNQVLIPSDLDLKPLEPEVEPPTSGEKMKPVREPAPVGNG